MGGFRVLIRLILIAAALYLLYRLFWKKGPKFPTLGRKQQRGQEEVLVQDPWCKTYVPRGQAISLEHRGETLYFCSHECRDRFLAGGGSQGAG